MNRRKILEGIAIVVFGVAVEIFRNLTGIPVTALDILVFPFFVLLIYATLRYIFTKHKKQKKVAGTAPTNRELLFGIVVFLLLLPLGIWSIYIGAKHPWQLYTGVRGWVHGYTAFMLGIVIAVSSFIFVIYILRTASKRLRRRLSKLPGGK